MFYTKKLRRSLFTVLVLGVMVLGLGNAFNINTLAAGMAVTVAPATAPVSTATSVALSFTTTTTVSSAGTIEVVYPTASYSGTPVLSVATGLLGSTTVTTSGADTIASALVLSASIPVGANTITVAGLTTTGAGNNSFTVYTSGGDFGAGFQYVGNANQVTVRAVVPISLSFVIRNSADTANTNVCDMGNLSVTAVSSCSYRLKVATNAQYGYTINKSTSGNFSNGSYGFPNAAVGTAGTGGTAQAAGTPLYGARIVKGSITAPTGVTTLNAAYDAGATNDVEYVSTTEADLVSADKPNNPATTDTTNTSLVTHEAAVDASTPAGIYTQKVTYTVSPSFATPPPAPIQL
jgi:hypothetical protein